MKIKIKKKKKDKEKDKDKPEVEDETEDKEKEKTKKKKKIKEVKNSFDQVNKQKPIWTRKTEEVKPEEYTAFYKAITND